MPQNSARAVALDALRSWRTKREFADSIAAELFARVKLSSADRAFALELFYGCLRNLTLLDFWITELRRARVESSLRDVLRLGLYQLLIANIAEHAAVNETVAIAPIKQRPLVNAVLRNATRRRAKLQQRANEQPLSVHYSHPEFLIARWQKNFGPDATVALCAWNNRPPSVYARVNRLLISTADFLRTYPGSSLLANRENFVALSTGISQATAAGHCYIQDPSTAIACEVLGPKPAEKILDACAAPGGKTGYIAELMQNEGVLVACDRDQSRLKTLRQNLSSLGVRNAKIVAQDWPSTKIVPEIRSVAPFDRILLDAPCSNTGVMRRRVDVRWRLKTTDFIRMQKIQLEIARALVPLLKPGGTFVYSTCSLEEEENAQVIENLVTKIPTLQLEQRKTSLPFRDNFDGAFVARLRKLE